MDFSGEVDGKPTAPNLQQKLTISISKQRWDIYEHNLAIKISRNAAIRPEKLDAQRRRHDFPPNSESTQNTTKI